MGTEAETINGKVCSSMSGVVERERDEATGKSSSEVEIQKECEVLEKMKAQASVGWLGSQCRRHAREASGVGDGGTEKARASAGVQATFGESAHQASQPR
jgi:hypothetical protein